MKIAVSCFLANQCELKFPLKTTLRSYLEADEIFLYAGDRPTLEAWQMATKELEPQRPVHVSLIPSIIEKPQNIRQAKNAAIDATVPRTQCDSILVVDPDVALMPGWTRHVAIMCKSCRPPFRIYIQNAILFVDVGLMPFGTVLMERDFPGRLVADGSYFDPGNPAIGSPIALHLGYLTISAVRRHLARNKKVWSEQIGGGGVSVLEEYGKLDDHRLATEVLFDIRDGRKPGIHMLNYGNAQKPLNIVTELPEDAPGRHLGSWAKELFGEIGAEAELVIVQKIISEIGRDPKPPGEEK